jgi:transcriptional antiterminator NusG
MSVLASGTPWGIRADASITSFNGDVTEIDETKKRVKVNVRIFGRETPLELSFLQIDKV